MSNTMSTTSMAALRLQWDVFLSFRGADTRGTITSRLYKSLDKQGVRVFLDDVGLDKGDEIETGLFEAIEDSAASILLISPRYASSHWCLKEMTRLCELGRRILPVFYEVEPFHVRRQKGPFEKDFDKHVSRYGEEIVEKWRKAMEKVGGKSGWVFNNGSSDEQLVESLVKRVLRELSNTPMVVATYSIGLDSRVEKLMKVLDVKSSGIQILGLHGMGGIGKTTLAKALYNKLIGHFEYRSFISDVREISAQHKDGLESLQNQIISDLTRGRFPTISGVRAGISAIKGIVYEKRVLVVLDDVDDAWQLEALAGKREWFYEGSRIIITTRDREILQKNYVNQTYEVRELDHLQAVQLFCCHALRREKPPDNFLDLSKKMVSLTGGLPLALELIGSFLSDKRTTKEWEDSLQKMRHIRPKHLQDLLRFSYDGLDEQVQCIFLDIACLFVKMRMSREDVVDIMKGCGFGAEIAISVLTRKSLIKITVDNTIWMHDQLRDMGRQIVQEQNLLDHGMRSRLWDREEIMTVLENNKGTRNIEGVVLDFEKRMEPSGVTISWNNFQRRPNFASAVAYLKEIYKKYLQDGEEYENQVVLHSKPFELMVNLRLLQINQVKLKGSFKYFPAELKWLQWRGCPLRTLPSDFHPRKLAVLDLSESKIERVWGWNSRKVAEKLMVLNLKGCYNLDAIPDLSAHQNLEKLILERCSKITRLHKSIGSLSTLLFLNLSDCINLVEFPSEVSGLKNLETLILSGCSQLKELPKNMGHMRSLKELLLSGTSISSLPESIFHLTNLEKLNLNGCQLLKELPRCIGMLVSLKELMLDNSVLVELPNSIGSLVNLEQLSLMWCKSLAEVPDSIGNLKSLKKFFIDRSAIKELPVSIGSLSYLKTLSASNCEFLGRLPDSIEGLASTVELQLGGKSITALPENIGSLKTLQKLEMRNCASLRSLPATIGGIFNLTTLTIRNAGIIELPESIGMLENLVMLCLNECKQLYKLPSSMGNLKSLHRLLMEETAVKEIPESVGMLSRLIVLRMKKKPLFRNSRPTEDTLQEKPQSVLLPTSFSNLSLLEELDARGCRISGRIPDEFEKLSSLELLNLGNNDFCSLPRSLRGLSLLKMLYLPYCEKLESIPPLPSSLQELNLADCFALECISDLSNLENLHELNMTNCEKVLDIPGLECLKSLRRLYLSGCNACTSAVKRRLSKVCLKNIRNLSMPGTKIPDWFSEGIIRFDEHKNLAITGVIIGVVVSLDHQIPDDLRNELPSIVDIQAKILKLGEPIFTTALLLMGVPRTNEDQVHLCRYSHFNPLVSLLKDGYKIEVTTKNPPFVKGVKLKVSGVHLVFENDDDYDGDEELLNESQKSVSERLAKFFTSIHEEDDHISNTGYEVERNVQDTAVEERTTSRHRRSFLSIFFRYFMILLLLSYPLLLSWLWSQF